MRTLIRWRPRELPLPQTTQLAWVASQGASMYKILEPTAQVLSTLAIPLALLLAFAVIRFPFGAW